LLIFRMGELAQISDDYLSFLPVGKLLIPTINILQRDKTFFSFTSFVRYEG
jgi:hypothetical protein